MKRYRVKLSVEERQELKILVSRGRGSACKPPHGRILLLSDEGRGDGAMKDEDIAGSCRLAVLRWSGCAGVVWRKGLRRRWDESSSSIVVQSDWTGRGKPT